MSAVYNYFDCDVKGFAIARKIDIAVGKLASSIRSSGIRAAGVRCTPVYVF